MSKSDPKWHRGCAFNPIKPVKLLPAIYKLGHVHGATNVSIAERLHAAASKEWLSKYDETLAKGSAEGHAGFSGFRAGRARKRGQH